MKARFESVITPPEGLATPSLWFLFKGFRLLVCRDKDQASIPILESPTDIDLTPLRSIYFGRLTGDSGVLHCFCGEVAEDVEAPSGMAFEGLRSLYAALDETGFSLAGRAVQIVDWDRTHQYCSQCGQPTGNQPQDRAKICANCGLTSYPRLSPAVIVRVQRETADGPQILLARAKRFPTRMFSVLAGFVEPGETLEECVEREIMEEVGLSVKNVAYFGSQPWPFPHSLMIAFTADYNSGEIVLDQIEMAEAGWFSPDSLPNTPPPPSIANRLITGWVDENGKSG
jgi:NAD+ diphosphatase